MERAVIYARFSSEHQTEASIDAQVRACREYAAKKRYTGVYMFSPVEEKNRADRRSKPNAIRIEGGMREIISKDIYNKVQEIMKERKQTGNKGDYLCSHLVYCANCGAKMHANRSTRKGHTYLRYVCSAH